MTLTKFVRMAAWAGLMGRTIPLGDLSVFSAMSDEALHKTCFPCHVPAKDRDYDFAGYAT